MIWIIGAVCLLGGAALGALLFKLYMSDEIRVKDLEEQLHTLQDEHENYKSSVHSHFNNSAQLLNRLTESYKDVYLHMADGARSLCPEYISSQLSLSGESRALLNTDTEHRHASMVPPLDYAARSSPDDPGMLSDDYGIDKNNAETDVSRSGN